MLVRWGLETSPRVRVYVAVDIIVEERELCRTGTTIAHATTRLFLCVFSTFFVCFLFFCLRRVYGEERTVCVSKNAASSGSFAG